MTKIFYILIWYISSVQLSFADWWILWDFKDATAGDTEWENTKIALREWDIHLEDIPVIIRGGIDFFIDIAWTIAIISSFL